MEPINFLNKFDLFSEHWSPKVIAEMNDYQFKVVRLKGDFIWHTHVETDEAFIVIDGIMGIRLEQKTVKLRTGEMFIVKKGIKHQPFALEECKALIIEPLGIKNTGDRGGELTEQNNLWI